MGTVLLILQGFLMGYVASVAYNGELSVGFWAVMVLNAILIVAYGAAEASEGI